MIENIVYDPNRPEPVRIEMHKGSSLELHVDANYWATREGGALSSAAWSVKEGDVTVGADTESSNVSTALVTASSEGMALIEVTLTLDSSGGDQVGIQYIRILTPVVESKRGIKY